jgi:hypothetical protein
MLKLKDQIKKHNVKSAAHDRAAEASGTWKNAPVQKRYSEPRDQPEGAPWNDGQVWLRWRESADRSGSSGSQSEPGYAVSSADTYESDALAYSLRHQLWEGESAADSLNTDSISSTQASAPVSNSTGALNFRWLFVVLCVLAAIGFAFAAGFSGLIYNRLQAKPTAAEIRVAASWLATGTPTPGATPTLPPMRMATAARTALPSHVPPTLTSRSFVPTVTPYYYDVYPRGCHSSGRTYIEGTVSNQYGEVYGARVTLGSSPSGDVIQTLITGTDRSTGYYSFILSENGLREGIFYVWITNSAGKLLSDPSAGRVVTNTIENNDDPAACWQANIDFVAARS